MRRTLIAAAFTSGIPAPSLQSGGFARSITHGEMKGEGGGPNGI
jgi:hypothetical protein